MEVKLTKEEIMMRKETTTREVTVCKECKFAERGNSIAEKALIVVTGFCLNEDAPVSEYVMGSKICKSINGGYCKFFKSKVE